jgi:hypothetical protein
MLDAIVLGRKQLIKSDYGHNLYFHMGQVNYHINRLTSKIFYLKRGDPE